MKKKFILLAMMLLTLIGGVNLNVLNAQTQYRVKFTTLNQYLTIFNNTSNPSGPVGGVGVDVYQESNAQKFTIETGANGGVYLKSADGYYIYCNGGSGGWNVDAINGSDKSELYGFDMTGGSFKIYDDNGYIKVEEVNSAYYIFHNAASSIAASWQLEEVTTGGEGGDEPSGDVCTLELSLKDGYGDGWSGCKIVVANGGTSNEFSVTQGGTTPYTFTCDVVSGTSVTLSFVCGSSGYYSYPTECTWTIKYQDGDDIWSGTGSLDGSSHTFTASCEAAVMPEIPTGLVATAESHKVISLQWDAAENAKKYNVYQEGELIASGITETSYVIESGIQAQTEYCFSVTAINGALETEHSDEACVTTPEVVAPVGPQTIAIGSASATYNYLPIATYYYQSYSQQIYTSDEIGFPFPGSVISKIKLYSSGTNLQRNVRIYMLNTDKESFSGTSDWVKNVTDENKVYDGTITTTSTIEIPISDFIYEGGNIILCFHDITMTCPMSTAFNAYPTSGRALARYLDSSTIWDLTTMSGGGACSFNNQIEFTIEVPSPTVEVNYTSLDFGTVRAGGDFWTEKETPSFDVNVKAKNTTIKTITGNDDFFKFSDVSGAVDQTEFNFTVSYNKEAEAGEKSGKIVVTYMNGEEEATVEIPMTATAYVPAQGDVVENPKAITFTEGAYTDNVTGVYDDYILPGEDNDGNNGDAVYTFTLTEESLISANVDGTNGLVAIYKAADLEGNGPSSENSFAGNDDVPEVSTAPTTFFYDFEDGSLEDFILIEKDVETAGYSNHLKNWEILTGQGVDNSTCIHSQSYSSNPKINNADNYIVTKSKYSINSTSKLIFDGRHSHDGDPDGLYIEVSTDGVTFTQLGEKVTFSGAVYNNIQFDLGAKLEASGLAYGEYHIALHHNEHYHNFVRVDNLQLTDGSKSRSLAQTRSTSPQIENVYPAGEYVLVAAAEGDFTLNITTGDIPAPEATTYVSPENNDTEVADATLVFQLGKYTDEYQVLVGTSADALGTVVDWTSELATTYTLADAANNTKYYWQVNTRNAKDVETTGEVWSFVTPLDVPQNVTATATELYQDNNTTTISWTEMEGLTYNVYVNGVKQNEEAVTATEYVLSDLAWSPEGHSVTVTAIHGELGESPMSEAVVVKVAGTFTITVNAVEDATVALSYSEGATDEFGNQLEDVYTNVTTDVNGQAVFENVKLLGDWSAHYYEINVTKGLYNEEVYVINNVTIAHDENYEVDVEMTLTTPNFNVSSETIHVGESVTLTWDAIEAENVTYNVYVNGAKHNAEAITAAEYVISDLAYNMNPGNAVAVTAVHSLGETPQDPIYVKVAGTFTLTVNVTDGTNPIEGATVNIDMAYAYDEFKNQISPVTVEPTGDDGKTTIELPILCNEDGFNNNNGDWVTSYYTVAVSRSPYQDNNWNYINYYEDVTSGYTMDVVLALPMVNYIRVQDEEGEYLSGDVMEGTKVVLSWDEVEDADAYKVSKLVNGEVESSETVTETTYTIEGVLKGYQYAVSALFGDLESEKCYASLTVKGNGYFKGYVTDGTSALQGIQVKVSSEYGDASAVVTTDEEGYFIGEIMEGDNYILTISHSDYDEFISTPFPIVYQTDYNFETIELNAKPSSDVTSVTATVNGDNVYVEWTVEEATKYNVYRRLASAQDCGEMIAEEIEGTTYTDTQWTTVAPGTYQYGVAGFVEGGTEMGVQLSENFDDNVMPEGWINEYNTQYDKWNVSDGVLYSQWSGDYYLTISQVISTSGATMTFKYMNPQYDAASRSEIHVYYSTSLDGELNEIATYSSSGYNYQETSIDLSVISEEEIYITIANINTGEGGDGAYIDDLVITGEVTSEVETQIVWSNDVEKKAPVMFYAYEDTDWNNPNNWNVKRLPTAEDEVVILTSVNISSEANANSLNIASGSTVTVDENGVLNVAAGITNNGSLVLNDGGQIFQNNANIYAKFNMGIENPTSWSDETSSKDGWQFISSPFNAAEISLFTGLFVPKSYDLYKYDGTQDLEWINHKSETEFEETFVNGRGYLASYETVTSVELAGYLYYAKSFTWDNLTHAEKDLANFHLLGNPFTFDMDMSKATYTNLVEGYAVVNPADGGYKYFAVRSSQNTADGTIKVGDGFFVKATGENPTLSYDAEAKAKRGESFNSLNITATGNAGEDNVIINFAGKSEGFNKLQNFNDAIATVYVAEDGKNYGIYNCDADVQEIELNFNANQMGNYTISIEPNGKFQTVTLVDRFTGIETNMLVEDYNFTAMSGVNNNRFIVKLAVSDQQSAVSDNFVYQSGEDLIIDAEGTVQIIDVMGRVLLSDEVESTNNRINVSGFRNGTYMVRVINGSEVKVEKVVIY